MKQHQESPKLSVIVPMFNAGHYVKDAIESLLRQNFRSFEILVMDDSSTDQSVAIAESFKDPRIRTFKGTRQGGPAHARNWGLDKARGLYIAFFDADDVAFPWMIEEQVRFLDANNHLDIVSGWADVINEDGEVIRRGIGYNGSNEEIPARMLFRNHLITSTVVCRRAAINALRFDESLPIASDYDMWARIIQCRQTAIIKRPLVRYRSHAANITHSRHLLAQSCLETIARRQLSRLGLNPTRVELDAHLLPRSAPTSEIENPLAALEAIARWLRRLEEQNRQNGVYLESPFGRVLGERWYLACYSRIGSDHRIASRYSAANIGQGRLRDVITLHVKALRGRIKRILARESRSSIPNN